jgi:hypothetical protein
MMARRKPILCVDFDGVIHSYISPWINEFTIPDAPVPGALRWLWAATEWFDVQIYSSRSKTEDGRTAMMAWMCVHSVSEFGPDHPMCGHQDPDFVYPIKFAHEKPAAFLTIDDRALTFEGDWSDFGESPADLLSFKPWNKRPKPAPLAPYDDGRKPGTSKLVYDKERRTIVGGSQEIRPETDVPLA